MRRLGRVSGGKRSGGVVLVAIERSGGREVFWGPFGSIDEVIKFCELSSAVVSVVQLSSPESGLVGV